MSFSDFGLKWDIIGYSTLTAEGQQASRNGMKRTAIQLSFDATFIPVSLILECVLPSPNQIFASGDPLVARFESRPRRIFSLERETNFSHRAGAVPLLIPCDLCEGMSISEFFLSSLGLSKVLQRY